MIELIMALVAGFFLLAWLLGPTHHDYDEWPPKQPPQGTDAS